MQWFIFKSALLSYVNLCRTPVSSTFIFELSCVTERRQRAVCTLVQSTGRFLGKGSNIWKRKSFGSIKRRLSRLPADWLTFTWVGGSLRGRRGGWRYRGANSGVSKVANKACETGYVSQRANDCLEADRGRVSVGDSRGGASRRSSS